MDNYSYFFYMETDVLPIQQDWAEILWILTRDIFGYWQKGGMIRTRNFLERGWGPDLHINGNSLYKSGDICFQNFLKRVQSTFPHKPFDMGLRAFRLDDNRFVEQQRFMHKFVYSDFLQNHGDGYSSFSRKKVSKMSPNTYFVHSKQPLEGEYVVHSQVEKSMRMVKGYVENCTLETSEMQKDWDLFLYRESQKEYWANLYKNIPD
jgi:hypothetical protein